MRTATKQIKEETGGLMISVKDLKMSVNALNVIFSAQGLKKESKFRWKQVFRQVTAKLIEIDEEINNVNERFKEDEKALNEALEKLAEKPVTLVLTSMKMSDLGSLDLTIVDLAALDWLIVE